jgi:opacity protein-like surface antigen
MKKIITVLSLSLALYSLSDAHHKHKSHRPKHHTNLLHSRIFIGGQAGIINGQYRNYAVSSADVNGDDTVSLENKFIDQSTSPQAGAHLGIEFMKDRLYFAAVVAANYSHQQYLGDARATAAPTPTTNLENRTSVKVHGIVYEVTVHPGLVFRNNTALYGIFGVDRTKFLIDSTTNYFYRSTATSTDIDVGNLIISDQKRATGAIFGVGLRTEVLPRVNMYAEYAYHRYQTLSLGGNVPTIGAQATDAVTNTTSIRPRHHSIMAGIDYELNT